MSEHNVKTLLIVGAEENDFAWSNLIEKAAIGVSQDSTVTGLTLPAASLRGTRRLVCDGRNLPFADKQFDFVLCNAVIEHVGNSADQKALMVEISRVGRHFYVTTPNRWFPVESHTRVLFLHWRPAWRERQASAFTRLLSIREFEQLLPPGTELRGHCLAMSLRGLR